MLEHIDDSLRRYPRLADQRNADNQCRIATDEVVEELRAQGHPSEGDLGPRPDFGQAPDARDGGKRCSLSV